MHIIMQFVSKIFFKISKPNQAAFKVSEGFFPGDH